MFLIDTNVVSELRKTRSGRADSKVVAWMADAPAAALYLSAITVLELELGALLMERRDPAQGLAIRRWVEDRILPTFAGRILPIDIDVARRAAALHVPDPRPDRDALIAATALVHGLVVVTRNVPDFEPTGATVVNPWTAAASG
jgi:predicted nucleic acid-binding protein